MGISRFYTIKWVEPKGFSTSWRVRRRRARVAIDILSFAIGKDAINCETLMNRLSRVINGIASSYIIEHVAIFLDGNQTHTLKNAEQLRRKKQCDANIQKQLSYVKECKWKDYVIRGIARQLHIPNDEVKLYRMNGEADLQIFQHFNSWGIDSIDVDNMIISSDSDVYFMAHLYRKITWFVRRRPGHDYLMYNVDSTDVTKTQMMKFAVLNKTDFYPLLYGGQYTDTDPGEVWKLDVNNIPSAARTVLDFVKMVLIKPKMKRTVCTSADVETVVATFARRIWFLLTALQQAPKIDEDRVLESKCEKRQVVSVLMNHDIDEIASKVADFFQQQNEPAADCIQATTD